MAEILDKQVGIDIDGDKKPDIKLDIKSIAIVVGFLISGVTGYNKLKQEIEVAKQLPVYEVQETADGALLKQKVHYLEKEIEKLEDKVNNLENKVYKNDRLVKYKSIEHGLDREEPRTIIAISRLSNKELVVKKLNEILDKEE